MNGGNNPMKPRELQGQNQKEEFPEPACQEKPFVRAFFAWMMDDQVGESVAWVMEKRIFGPAAYLLNNRSTQSFEEDWSISQTSLRKRQILVSLAVLIPKPPWCFGREILFQPTRWIPLLFESLQMKFRVVWSMLSHTHFEGAMQYACSKKGWRKGQKMQESISQVFKSLVFQEAKRVCIFSIIKRKSLRLALPLKIGKPK